MSNKIEYKFLVILAVFLAELLLSKAIAQSVERIEVEVNSNFPRFSYEAEASIEEQVAEDMDNFPYPDRRSERQDFRFRLYFDGDFGLYKTLTVENLDRGETLTYQFQPEAHEKEIKRGIRIKVFNDRGAPITAGDFGELFEVESALKNPNENHQSFNLVLQERLERFRSLFISHFFGKDTPGEERLTYYKLILNGLPVDVIFTQTRDLTAEGFSFGAIHYIIVGNRLFHFVFGSHPNRLIIESPVPAELPGTGYQRYVSLKTTKK